MPIFHYPWLLLLLPLVPLAMWRWRRQPRPTLRFPNLKAFTGLGRSEKPALWFKGLAVATLILALAGPVWPDVASREPVEGVSIALVLDISRSMDNQDFFFEGDVISRLEGVKRLFRRFIDGGLLPNGMTLAKRPHDLIALITFATRPETACPLTLDHDALLAILDRVQARSLVSDAASNPGDAIALALLQLEKAPTRSKAVVLLSDGESNVPAPALKPRQVGQLAAAMKVPIYTLDAGHDDDFSAGDAKAARKTLQELAAMTGGRHFLANDGVSLTEAIEAIDRLERDRIDGYVYRKQLDLTPWIALVCLGLWLGLVGLETTRWRSVP